MNRDELIEQQIERYVDAFVMTPRKRCNGRRFKM